ncbi:NeuD/PglB/VioB family sugar acetyltransferase [Intrasporangium sp.]|uniref:NeuD/PglB/VioB family sugar acetyltransferase n=1 Tax=Intrasporangium sp. TaxID=1925024 RepID=UPI00293B1411|nr:NeuD/PglB/VioB family sugar acetyltransferase [Intrasporangium sp.]MDV3222700.1 NeuD/PglB/VioB family sugar acetyltransferase [Intrasporangium sp.]
MSELPYAAEPPPRARDASRGAGWVVFGAGGHARSVVDVLERLGETVVAVVGDAGGRDWNAEHRVEHLTDEAGAIDRVLDGGLRAVVAIGAPGPRLALSRRLAEVAPAVVAATATVAPGAELGPGTVVLEHAHVGPAARLGLGVIVNTGANVEHDCVVGDGTHVAPGAALLGAATVGSEALVGSGARVLPGITVGAGVTIGAGAVVTRDVPAGVTVAGIPARVTGSSSARDQGAS